MTGRHAYPDKLALSALRRGAFLLGSRPPLKPGLAPAFPKKESPTVVRGLLGGWLMGFEPTTPEPQSSALTN